MRTERTKLLAGIAVLALLAGTSLVSAQDKSDQNASPQTQQPGGAQQMDKTAPAEKMGQESKTMGTSETPKSAQMNGKRKAASDSNAITRNRTAQSDQHKLGAKKNEMARNERSKGSRTAEERSRMTRQRAVAQEQGRNAMQKRENTAQSERNGLKGLQGNASGTNVQLSNEQRDQIRTTVIHGRNAPRVGNVNFDVTVGTMIPHGFHAVPVPGTLVRIEPQWHGFLYFVYQDEIVIVNPRDMRIVAVVPA